MRLKPLGLINVLLATVMLLGSVSSTASAQSTPEVTIEDLQERVAELEEENEALKEENEKLKQRIEDMSGTSRTPRQGSGDSEADEAPTLQVGETWISDEWSITVTYVEVTPTLSTSYETNTARGVYAIVHMTIVNESSAPVAFPYRDLKIVDSDGRTYSVDDDALFNLTYVVMGAGSVYDEMQPGLPYDTGAIFDIPATATGLTLTTGNKVFLIELD